MQVRSTYKEYTELLQVTCDREINLMKKIIKLVHYGNGPLQWCCAKSLAQLLPTDFSTIAFRGLSQKNDR